MKENTVCWWIKTVSMVSYSATCRTQVSLHAFENYANLLCSGQRSGDALSNVSKLNKSSEKIEQIDQPTRDCITINFLNFQTIFFSCSQIKCWSGYDVCPGYDVKLHPPPLD